MTTVLIETIICENPVVVGDEDRIKIKNAK